MERDWRPLNTLPRILFLSGQAGGWPVLAQQEQTGVVGLLYTGYTQGIQGDCHTNLLHGKDECVEEALQLLVGNVNAQLLQAVLHKVLKAKHVQNANGKTLNAVGYEAVKYNMGIT